MVEVYDGDGGWSDLVDVGDGGGVWWRWWVEWSNLS